MSNTPTDNAWLDEVLQDLCDYVYNTGVSAKNNGIFVGGEPKAKAKQAILTHIDTVCREAERAYGGCRNCYGKGYSTARIGTSSRYGNKTHDTIIYCKCERGKQLAALTQLNPNKEI